MIVFSTPRSSEIHGIAAALDKMFGVTIWNPEHVAVYDMFEELKPSFLFTSDDILFPAVKDAIEEYGCKCINYGVSGFGDLALVPKNVPQSIVEELSNYILLQKRTNLALYRGGCYNRRLATDISYISNFDLKNRQYIIDFLTGPLTNCKYSVKCAGVIRLPLISFIGTCEGFECMSLMKSSKICIDFDEDIMWDCAANKVFCLTNSDTALFPSLTMENIDRYLLSKERDKKIRRAHKLAMENTYFHEVAKIAEKLDVNWQDKAMETLRNLRTN